MGHPTPGQARKRTPGAHAPGALQNAPGGNTWAPECETRGPSPPSPPAPPPSPASLRGERATFQLEKQLYTPTVRPPPAFKSGRGVSSNLSPYRPRTPPPPPHPERETKGRTRRVPPGGFPELSLKCFAKSWRKLLEIIIHGKCPQPNVE